MAAPDFAKLKHAEDADVDAIRVALKGLEKAGLDPNNVNSFVYNLVTPSECDECHRVWLKTRCRSLPDWEGSSNKRGRRLELTTVRQKIDELGWTRRPDYCPSCMLEKAEPFGKALAKTLTAQEMKRFVTAFSLRIDNAMNYGMARFRETPDFSFYVLFTRAFFEEIPAKNRKSFGLLTQVMHKLELI